MTLFRKKTSVICRHRNIKASLWWPEFYIHNILNCSYPTIDAGIEDLKRDEISGCRQARNSGGERKPSVESIVGIDDLF